MGKKSYRASHSCRNTVEIYLFFCWKLVTLSIIIVLHSTPIVLEALGYLDLFICCRTSSDKLLKIEGEYIKEKL